MGDHQMHSWHRGEARSVVDQTIEASFAPRLLRFAVLIAAGLVVLGTCVTPLQAQTNRHALIIGINNYEKTYQIPDLRFAEADASTLKSVLEARGVEVRLLTNQQATTREQIVRALNKFARELTDDDDFILFFAGHGARRESNGKTYWLASDADILELDVNGIRLDHLMDYVSDIPARNKLVLLDHCYAGDVRIQEATSGAGGSGGRGPGNDATGLIDRGVFRIEDVRTELEKPRNLTVIAGARNEAYEDSTLGHGVFTKALIDAIRDGGADGFDGGTLDDRIEVSELIAYTRSRVFELADTTALHDKGFLQEVIAHSVSINSADFEVVVLPSEHVSQDDIDRFQLVLGRWAGTGLLSDNAMEACMGVLAKKSGGQALDENEREILKNIQRWVASGGEEMRETAGLSLDAVVRGLLE